jgi:hypothetical protein
MIATIYSGGTKPTIRKNRTGITLYEFTEIQSTANVSHFLQYHVKGQGMMMVCVHVK